MLKFGTMKLKPSVMFENIFRLFILSQTVVLALFV